MPPELPPALGTNDAGCRRAVHMFGLGRVQRGIRRAFLAQPDRPLLTRELAEWCFPRVTKLENKHLVSICRACRRMAIVRVGREWRGRFSRTPGGVLWRTK